jgi:hypothetical protein
MKRMTAAAMPRPVLVIATAAIELAKTIATGRA